MAFLSLARGKRESAVVATAFCIIFVLLVSPLLSEEKFHGNLSNFFSDGVFVRTISFLKKMLSVRPPLKGIFLAGSNF